MFRTAFCIGIFNSKNLPIFLLRRFMPLFHYTTIHPGSQRFPADGNHPRLCGEKRDTSVLLQSGYGSPPPMRGKAALVPTDKDNNRITPAYAGKRSSLTASRKESWDHPRLCGEKLVHSRYAWRYFGSPPPMRGKARSISCSFLFHRITPAYAGKSGKAGKGIGNRQDHPRLCGEKPALHTTSMLSTGSPPPMRGKVRRFRRLWSLSRDHPRLCGEKKS